MDDPKKTFSGQPFLEVDHLITSDRNYLYCKYWKPEGDVKFLICLVHGFGGHCARYEEFAGYLNKIGGLVFAHDHIGHGESEGERTNVGNYEIYIRDILQHVEKMKTSHPNLPMFLFGQSMGGALAVIASHEKPQLFKGVIVLAGMLKTDPQMASPFKKFLINSVATFLPSLRLSTLDESQSSRDKNEVESCENDPLRSSNVKSQMASQLIRIGEAVQEIMDDFSLPFLALHGDADKTCDPECSRMLHQRSKSTDKTLKIYPECYHDLLHELPEDKKLCMEDICQWISDRLHS